jgi:hypothetical protein
MLIFTVSPSGNAYGEGLTLGVMLTLVGRFAGLAERDRFSGCRLCSARGTFFGSEVARHSVVGAFEWCVQQERLSTGVL